MEQLCESRLTGPLGLFGDPNYQVDNGRAEIKNRTLRDLGQDLYDGLASCASPDNGGWHYGCGNTGTDGSTNGWTAAAMGRLESELNLTAYPWLKESQRSFLAANCNANSNDNFLLYGCTYNVSNSRLGGTGKLSGNALAAYAWALDGDFTSDLDGAQQYLPHHYEASSALNHPDWGDYYMYMAKTAFTAFEPAITTFSDGSRWQDEFSEFVLGWQLDNGAFARCTDGSCEGFYISQSYQTETVIHTEIVQSWDMVQAVAALSHTRVVPGTTVTFSHKDSHVLNAQARMKNFIWSIKNKNTDDILWQDNTNILDQALSYTFDTNLEWDESVVYTVTLTVTDAEGRNYVDDAYEITVDLENHAPTVVLNSNGGPYSAYAGAAVQIDARDSFDVDAAPINDRVFEADDTRPNGVPDSITSICVDIDRDGNWCEDGEDGLINAVSFTVADDYKDGSTIAVPVRVCDDGRWNGKCYELSMVRLQRSPKTIAAAAPTLMPSFKSSDVELTQMETAFCRAFAAVSIATTRMPALIREQMISQAMRSIPIATILMGSRFAATVRLKAMKAATMAIPMTAMAATAYVEPRFATAVAFVMPMPPTTTRHAYAATAPLNLRKPATMVIPMLAMAAVPPAPSKTTNAW